jgi:hypothetical protein
MSDYRVIAAATLTLQNLLLDAIRDSAPGATVKTGPPEVHPPEEVGEGLINIFLYKVEPNRVWRNEDLPYRRGDGSLMRRPQVAVDVHFLLSFYGDERRKIPYLLMGLAMSALHAEPYPSVRHMPQVTEGVSGDDFGETDPVSTSLAGSGLEQQTHPLSFTFMPLSHDELVPLFSQIPFVMSVAYRGSVLLIEPLVTPVPPMPVRRADFYVTSARRPVLASISPQLLPYGHDAQVELRGEALASAAGARVLFGSLEATPAPQPDGSLRSPLPDGLQAGTHLVRVAQATAEAEGGAPVRWAIESNPVALVVEPVVVDAVQVALPAAAGAVTGIKPAGLQVRFAPAVTSRTPVLVLLNEISRDPGRRSRAYALQIDAEPTSPDLVALRAEVEPGSYLVRVQINGVTSRLGVDTDPASPTFDRYAVPRVTIV